MLLFKCDYIRTLVRALKLNSKNNKKKIDKSKRQATENKCF